MEEITPEYNKKDIKNKKISEHQKQMTTRVIDGVFSMVLMMLAIYSFLEMLTGGSGIVTGFLFATLAISKFLWMLFYKIRVNKLQLIIDLIFLAGFIALSVCTFIFGITQTIILLYGIGYLAVLIINRTISIFNKKTIRNIILNIVAILLLLALLVLFITDNESKEFFAIIIGFIIAGQSLVHIIVVSFSQMKLNILLKIIRKTFAAEILFGLLLLIFAFSFVFQVIEPNIKNYGDALWYCFAVVTTIGFGDFTVLSPLSRVLSVILGIYGIVTVAVITSIIVNFYNEVRMEKEDENIIAKKYGEKPDNDK